MWRHVFYCHQFKLDYQERANEIERTPVFRRWEIYRCLGIRTDFFSDLYKIYFSPLKLQKDRGTKSGRSENSKKVHCSKWTLPTCEDNRQPAMHVAVCSDNLLVEAKADRKRLQLELLVAQLILGVGQETWEPHWVIVMRYLPLGTEGFLIKAILVNTWSYLFCRSMSKASRTGMAKAIQIVNTNIVERGQVDLTLSKEHPWNPSPFWASIEGLLYTSLSRLGGRKK